MQAARIAGQIREGRSMKKKRHRSVLVFVLIMLLAGMVLPALPAPLAPEEVVAQGEVTYPPFVPDSAITNMKAVAFEDDQDSNPCGAGWKWIDVDLNKLAGGDWVYFCYQEGAPSNAITDIKFILNTTNCGSGYTRDSTDLNDDAGGDDIYLCYRKGGALPIIKLDVVTGITSLVACPRFDGQNWTKNPTDLNSDAGGLYIYLCYVDLAGTAGIDNCGNEDEGPCTILTTFFWENGSGTCDRGLRQVGDECINGLGDHARYNQGDEVRAFQNSWTLWALQNQRKHLAWNEPLTGVMHIGAHNAYNNTADGYIFSNQTYSITDMLRAGVRLIELDVHSGTASRTGTNPQLCHAQADHVGCVVGDRDFYNAIKEIRYWMTRPGNADEVVLLFLEAYVPDADEGYVAGVLDLYLGGPDIGLYTRDDWVADGSSSLPSQSDLVARGKRVIAYTNQKQVEPLLREGDITDGASFVGTLVDDLDTANCQVNGAAVNATFPEFRRVYDNRVPVIGGDVRLVTPGEMADFARCNVTLIDIDDILDYDDDTTRGDRLKRAVWSWAEGERGQPGEAAFINDSNNRWYGDTPESEHHYVCFDESGSTTVTSDDFGDIFWRVTDATGPFEDGIAACQTEFPGSTFNVPRNGYENALLGEVLEDADGPAWLNYHDTNADGWWASLPDGFISGPTTIAEGSNPQYTTGLDFDAEIIDASCGDGAPAGLDFASELIGDTVNAGEEISFGCLFTDGPATSTITLTFDDPNATTDVVEQLVVSIDNTAPQIFPRNGSVVTINEETNFNFTDFTVVDSGGIERFDGAGSENLTATVDWGDGTSQSGELWEGWKEEVRGVGYFTIATPTPQTPIQLPAPPHAWGVPGSYEVVATVCDKDGACDTSTLYTAEVLNVPASIGSMPIRVNLREGDTFELAVSITVPDNGDDYTLAIDYGDRSPRQEMAVTADDTSVDLSHTYADDGVRSVGITICDDEHFCVSSDTTVVDVDNVRPSTQSLGDFTVAEGEAFTRDLVSFTDPGFDCPAPSCDPPTQEEFTADISWGDGNEGSGNIDEAPGDVGTDTTGTVSGTHTYADNGIYTADVHVFDDNLGFADSQLTVTVENVAPSVATPVVMPTPSGEGEEVELTATFSDPAGSHDAPYICQISWGDGITTEGTLDGMSCTGSHTYADDSPSDGHSIEVTVVDKDGGSGSSSVVQNVSNVAPTISEIAVPNINEHHVQVPVSVTASDPAGVNDPLTYAFDCDGDGIFEQDTGATNSATCVVDPTTVSPDIVVRVSDDDLGITIQTITLAVEKHLCQHHPSGMLVGWNADEGCNRPYKEIVISGTESLELCVHSHSGVLMAQESCSRSGNIYVAPGPEPIHVCRPERNGKLRLLVDGDECKRSEVEDLIPAA